MPNSAHISDTVMSAAVDGAISETEMKAIAEAMALAGAGDPTKGAATICAAAMLVGYLASEDAMPFEAIKALIAEFEDNARCIMSRYLAIAPGADALTREIN